MRYEGWSSKWDEWLCVKKNAERLRPLGATVEDTEEIKRKKEEDVRESSLAFALVDSRSFRPQDRFCKALVASTGFKIVEMSRYAAHRPVFVSRAMLCGAAMATACSAASRTRFTMIRSGIRKFAKPVTITWCRLEINA